MQRYLCCYSGGGGAMSQLLEKVTPLAPVGGKDDLSIFLASKEAPGSRPFAAERISSLARFSTAILQDKALKQDPACVALGYWLRKSHLEKLRAAHEERQKAEKDLVFVASGRVFHVAPANVDTLFVYSWALSYLCGNANVVRLSTKPSLVVQALLRILGAQMKTDEDLAQGNRFVTYEHDEKVSEAFSRWCTHRVVWGGDETVKAIRAIPLNPHASDRAFASKFSYAVLSSVAWISAKPEEKARLAAAFFNDAFWFGQMACSSPHVIFWVGDRKKASEAAASFEQSLEAELRKRRHQEDASTSMKRISFSFKLAAQAEVRVRLHEGAFVSVEHRDCGELTKEICGGGVFRHARVNRVEEIVSFAGEEDQTVTHFGLAPEDLQTLAISLGARGVDRVVPIGEALAFDANWDGFSLIQDFLRRVTVRK